MTYRSAIGHMVARDANSQFTIFFYFEMQRNAKLLARAYVSALTHSHAYECKSKK